jgi:hypothetical protein
MSDNVGHGRRKIPHNIPQGKTSHKRKGGCWVAPALLLAGVAVAVAYVLVDARWGA